MFNNPNSEETLATTIWRKCWQGEYPQPIKVSSGITAWRVSEIRKYLEKLGARSGKEAA